MGFFSVSAERLGDVERQVLIHPFGSQQGWVDDGQFQYAPYKFLDSASEELSSRIDMRAAFSLNRRITGFNRWINDGILGQAALIESADDSGVSYLTAVLVPAKTKVLGRTENIVITADATNEMRVLPHVLQSPPTLAFFKQTISRAIFEAVNGFEPLNLTSKELNGS